MTAIQSHLVMENQLDHTLVSPPLATEKPKLKRPIRLGVMASGNGSNFANIAQAIAENNLQAEIMVVIYNNPDAKVKARAKSYAIPTVLLNHRDYKSREDLDRAIVEVLQEQQVELVVMAGWMRIVTDVLIQAFPRRIINIHPSLLPSFRGLQAVEQALEAGVKVTGCTVHFAEVEVDSGQIIIQSAVPITEDDNRESLQAKIQVQEHRIFPEAIAIVAPSLLTLNS